MSQFKTESSSKPISGNNFSVRPAVSVSAAAVLPTEPHPNPKPPEKVVQKEAIDNWENEGGHALVKPSKEEIAKRAYEIYVESGCVDGRCEENWHLAERELRKLTLAKQDFKNKEE